MILNNNGAWQLIHLSLSKMKSCSGEVINMPLRKFVENIIKQKEGMLVNPNAKLMLPVCKVNLAAAMKAFGFPSPDIALANYRCDVKFAAKYSRAVLGKFLSKRQKPENASDEVKTKAVKFILNQDIDNAVIGWRWETYSEVKNGPKGRKSSLWSEESLAQIDGDLAAGLKLKHYLVINSVDKEDVSAENIVSYYNCSI